MKLYLAILSLTVLALGAHAEETAAPAPLVQINGQSCIELPPYTPAAYKQGLRRWKDDTIMVFDSIKEGVIVPEGWFPVGAEKLKNNCALFPEGQSVVLVNMDDWDRKRIFIPTLNLYLHRYMPNKHVTQYADDFDAGLQRIFSNVRQLFPFGLDRKWRYRHDVLVTTNVAGNSASVNERLYPDPGPNLTTYHLNFNDRHGVVHLQEAALQLFNKHRPSVGALPDSPALDLEEHRAFVNSWGKLALLKDMYIRRSHISALLIAHNLVTDGDYNSWPDNADIAGMRFYTAPFGIEPFDDNTNEAEKTYAHDYLAPLILFAVDGLLIQQGSTTTVRDLIQQVHSQQKPDLLTAIKEELDMDGWAQVVNWLEGGHIPNIMVKNGVKNVTLSNFEKWQMPNTWPTEFLPHITLKQQMGTW